MQGIIEKNRTQERLIAAYQQEGHIDQDSETLKAAFQTLTEACSTICAYDGRPKMVRIFGEDDKVRAEIEGMTMNNNDKPMKPDVAYQRLIEACTNIKLMQSSNEDHKIRAEIEEMTKNKNNETINPGTSSF